jgi:hypothetical protein
VAFYTARTQYQSWFKCQKEMSAAEGKAIVASMKAQG